MTGNCVTDYSLIGVLGVVLGYLARQYGQDWLRKLAESLLKRKDDEKQPEPVAFVGKRENVALPTWLSFLLPFLLPLIQRLIDSLRESYGRELTADEKQEVADRVVEGYLTGRVKMTLED